MSEHIEWLQEQITAEVQGKLDKAVKLLRELNTCAVNFDWFQTKEYKQTLELKQAEVELFLESIKS